jgi:hypothetical protein
MNMSKISGIESAASPMPLSLTETTISLPSRPAASSMRPPGSVYFAALLSRLENTWASRVVSPSTGKGSRGSRTSSAWRRESMKGRAVSTASRSAERRSKTTLRTASLPVVMRETSIRSSTRRTSCPTWRCIISRAFSALTGSLPARRRISRALRMGASGLRSSCASVARNSSLRWSAERSASARRPISASIALNASTSSPISSAVVRCTRSE